ncbi:AmmeMemoRadiSam system radical SAM enzyme [Pontiella sp.]|uniref:AmmeMemoRadiSam system radical SAM enzyme n=1 Tax=Pontiella sp. TaxID=2837462 RepID=UPI00356249AD
MKAKTRCSICPKGCELALGEVGDCHVRQNIAGKITCITYGHPCSINIDPVEKKPLYHFLPGSSILSVGTAGCNLHCKHCQNWQISQSNHTATQTVTPLQISEYALKVNSPAIAYTYTEPLVSYEYTLDCCRAAVEMGIKNVLVTAAYINPEPLKQICSYIDAANVDLKSFSDEFYQTICDGRLAPVLKALKLMKDCGVMLEITYLMIPSLNGSEDETKRLCAWIVDNLGAQTPLHISRFYPQNKLQHLPPTATQTILRAREIALEAGLKFTYVGNLSDREGDSTRCPECGMRLIEREGYRILENRLSDGKCPNCQTHIPGIW